MKISNIRIYSYFIIIIYITQSISNNEFESDIRLYNENIATRSNNNHVYINIPINNLPHNTGNFANSNSFFSPSNPESLYNMAISFNNTTSTQDIETLQSPNSPEDNENNEVWICPINSSKKCLITGAQTYQQNMTNYVNFTNYNITIYNSIMNCTIPYCQLIINAANVNIINSSIIFSDIIIIVKNQLSINSAYLLANSSIIGGNGANINNNMGSAYTGLGGYCSSFTNLGLIAEPSYGNFDLIPTISSLLDEESESDDWIYRGSGTSYAPGGGRIVIIANSLVTNLTKDFGISVLDVSGSTPNCSQKLGKTNGGSGGYIYINVTSIELNPNLMQYNTSGGSGCSGIGYGGSGGRIIVNISNSPQSYYFIGNISGGVSNSPNQVCLDGAAGTYYDIKFQSLKISGGNNTAAQTIINANGTTQLQQMTISDNAQVSCSINMTTNLCLIANLTKLTIDYPGIFSPLIFGYIQNVTSIIQVQHIMINGGPNMIIPTPMSLIINCSTIGMYPTNNISSIIYSNNITIIADGELNDIQILEPYDASKLSYVYIFGDQYTMNGLIISDYIFIYVNNIELAGVIIGNITSCLDTSNVDYVIVNPFLDYYYDPSCDQNNDNFTLKSSIQKYLNIVIDDNNLNTNLCIDYFNQLIPFNETDNENNNDNEYIQTNYTVFISANDYIVFQNASNTIGSRIGIFATNILIEEGAIISSSEEGCPSNYGIGKGIKDNTCAPFCGGSGGSYGSIGGVGSILLNGFSTNICTLLISPPYGDANNPIFEGSGGGSPSKYNGGSGGGVIIVGGYNIRLDGIIESEGGSPFLSQKTSIINQVGSGSGGSIQIHYVNYLNGIGNLSVNGGMHPNNGGYGGAGRIMFNYLNWANGGSNNSDFTANIYAFDGNQNLTAIPNYTHALTSRGTIVSTPCPPGYGGLFCLPCIKDQYSSDYSNQPCLQCNNNRSKYVDFLNIIQTSPICAYECQSDVPNVNENPNCLSNFSYYTYKFGSIYVIIFIIYAIVILLIVVMVEVTGNYAKKKNTRKEVEKTKEYKSNSLKRSQAFSRNSSAANFRNLSIASRKSSFEEIDKGNVPDFILEDIPFHKFRLYFLGSNTCNDWWSLPKEVPIQLKHSVRRELYLNFINKVNKLCSWSILENYGLIILSALYYPLYAILLNYQKRKILRKFRTMIKREDKAFWLDLRARELTCEVKISCSDDYSLAYFDILNHETSVLDWNLNTKFPIELAISGEGHFLSPFNLNVTDPLVTTVSLSLKQLLEKGLHDYSYGFDGNDGKKLEKFLIKFNNYLRCIDIYGPSNLLIKNMHDLLNYIKKSNLKVFNFYKIKIEFWVYYKIVNQNHDIDTFKKVGLCSLNTDRLNELILAIHHLKHYKQNSDIKFYAIFDQYNQAGQKLHNIGNTGEYTGNNVGSAGIGSVGNLYQQSMKELSQHNGKDKDNTSKKSKGNSEIGLSSSNSGSLEDIFMLRDDLKKKIALQSILLANEDDKNNNINIEDGNSIIMENTDSNNKDIDMENADDDLVYILKDSKDTNIRCITYIMRLFQNIRYLLLNYNAREINLYLLTVIYFTLITADLMITYILIFVDHKNLEIYIIYPFASIIVHLAGFLWIVLLNKTVLGKMFMIFNTLSLINYIFTCIIFFDWFFIAGIFVKIANSFIGRYYLTYIENVQDIATDDDEIETQGQ